MDVAIEHTIVLWPLVLFAAGTLALIGLMLGLSAVLGERHHAPLGNEPYESGIRPTGDAHIRFSPKFYLVAMLFVLFDLEVMFLFAWAIAAPELGWRGYFGFLFFLGVLALGLVYEWRIGALDWAPKAPRQSRLDSIAGNRRHNPQKDGE